ncbi:MAG: STAS domain-containing protein [Candidatus Zixiibacteriota bacterium]
MFDVKVGKDGTVQLIGRFDAAQAPRATDVLATLEGECIIDCRDLDYISSAGIGVLIATYTRLREQGKNLRLTNLNPNITRVLHYAGLTSIFEVG